MYITIKECPLCKATGRFYHKDGYDKTKHNHQSIPRYKCKECGRRFTSHTSRTNKYQKKPQINTLVFELACSGMTISKIAKNLNVDKKTVSRKIKWLADQSKMAHTEWLQKPENKALLVCANNVGFESLTAPRSINVLQDILWIRVAWNNGYDICKSVNDEFTFKQA